MTRSSSGFTLADLLVTLVLMSLVAAAVAVLVASTDRLAGSQASLIDAQQRARVVAVTLGRDLRQAGAGIDRGSMSGSLGKVFPAVWPRRLGRLRPDGVTVARADVVTLVYVPDTVLQTTLGSGDVPALGRVVLSPCAGGALPCPAVRGSTLAVFDALGRVDLLGVLDSDGVVAQVRPLATSGGNFEMGSTAAEVVIRGYYFDRVAAQVRLYDGDGSDQPVVDEVAGLTFEYFGDPAPPRWPRPSPGLENCLYLGSGEWRGGTTLAASDDGLAPLPLAMLTDGPWCGTGDTAFDADLLRVRRVRVAARLRVSGGRDPQPDYRVVFDVSPPNLTLGGAPGGAGGLW